MEVARSKKGIVVSLCKYILDLLKETGMSVCRPIDTPIDMNVKLGEIKYGTPVYKGRYQILVGKLIYLSHTCPDIVFAISMVSQFMHSPYEEHLEAVYRILRYIKTHQGEDYFLRNAKREKSRHIQMLIGQDQLLTGDQHLVLYVFKG